MPKRVTLRRSLAPARPLPSMAAVAWQPEAATPTTRAVTDDEVRTAAYHRWEAAGRPHGDGVEFWLAAERELRGEG